MPCKLSGMLFAMLGLTLWGTAAFAATLAGKVVAVSGPCSVHGLALNLGSALQVRDTVEVPAGSNLKLQMADGTVISIAPGSSMTVTRYDANSGGRDVKLSLEHGLLRAFVAPVRGPSGFEVSTAAGIASVRSDSADWFIKAQADSIQVGVLAGVVDVTSVATRRSASVPAHWGTRMESGLDPVLPRVWAQMEFNAVIRLTECCRTVQLKPETARPSGQ
jgi:hypothetical protein